ncbi:FecR family protein [Rhodohalobacter sp. 614A]|uniref:FecR family protein n=1 Tax=Rhodohalobacter sp. 614A TaxID=2908649 RepID=UPI001F453CBA|nr:FecR domain-containing protein [Rhodohalobacter sp. 614A]
MDLQKKTWVLIQRYVTGNATFEERRSLEEWMNQNADNRKLVEEIEEIWRMTPEENFSVDVEHAWQQFRLEKQKPLRVVSEKRERSARKQSAVYSDSKTMMYVLRAAAVVLVMFIAGSFSYYLTQLELKSEEIAEKSMFYQMQEMVTSRGEKAKVRFSDGTEVVLNSASSIRFPKEFRGSKREVYLDGEAFFKVAHDPDQPFIVHSHEAEVQVLGTEFNVRGWEEDSEMEVVVREGKVSVKSIVTESEDQPEVILTKGFKTELIRGEGLSPAVKVDPRYHMIWTSGGMHFDSVPLYKVFRDIERRFDVNIFLDDEDMMDVPFTSTFQYAELDEILSVIAASLEIGYTRNEREINFY